LKQKIIIVIILSVVLGYIFFPKKESVEEINISKINYSPFEVIVEGEVVFPGVYYFSKETTILEVIKMSGGYTSLASTQKINQREIIGSNKTIIVPKIEEIESSSNNRFDCNKVTFQELLNIPGMTETRAVCFLIYRTEVGKIKSVDELINVKNIGTATLEKIKPYLYV
jgi:competence protein ComEA